MKTKLDVKWSPIEMKRGSKIVHQLGNCQIKIRCINRTIFDHQNASFTYR